MSSAASRLGFASVSTLTALLCVAALTGPSPASATQVEVTFSGSVVFPEDVVGVLAPVGIVHGAPVSGTVVWDTAGADELSIPVFPHGAMWFHYDGSAAFSMSITAGTQTFASLENDPGGEGAVGTSDLAAYQDFFLDSTFSSRSVCPLGCLTMGLSFRDDVAPLTMLDGKDPRQIPDLLAAESVSGQVTSLGAGWEFSFIVDTLSVTVPEPGAASLLAVSLLAALSRHAAGRRGR